MYHRVVAEVSHAPIPFAGSDGRTHLVYELETTNFTSGQTTIEQLEVLDANTGDVVDTLDTEEVASRLQPAGLREAADALAPSMMANVFLHVTFDEASEVPDRLVHRLSLQAEAAPPDQQQTTEEVGPTEVERRNVVVVGPPLRGSNYLAADSCCDSALHRQATLPINGRITLAQRYAVDYEQLDADNRIYSGEGGRQLYDLRAGGDSGRRRHRRKGGRRGPRAGAWSLPRGHKPRRGRRQLGDPRHRRRQLRALRPLPAGQRPREGGRPGEAGRRAGLGGQLRQQLGAAPALPRDGRPTAAGVERATLRRRLVHGHRPERRHRGVQRSRARGHAS